MTRRFTDLTIFEQYLCWDRFRIDRNWLPPGNWSITRVLNLNNKEKTWSTETDDVPPYDVTEKT